MITAIGTVIAFGLISAAARLIRPPRGAAAARVTAVAIRMGGFAAFTIVLAIAAGLGGGIARDLLIGVSPPYAITHWSVLATAAVAGLVGFGAHGHVLRARRTVLVADAAAVSNTNGSRYRL